MSETSATKSEKSSGITLKDRLALIISLCALVLTGLNLWLNNWWVHERLEARLINVYMLGAIGRLDTQDTLLMEVAFINPGNRQAVILSPSCMISDAARLDDRLPPMVVSNQRDFPITLGPKEVRTVEVRVAAAIMLLNTGKLKPVEGMGTGVVTNSAP